MRFIRRGERDRDEPQEFGVAATGEALMAALRRRDLRVHVDGTGERARLFGSPGAIDFWMVTDVALDAGSVGFECVLPIPVAPDRSRATVP